MEKKNQYAAEAMEHVTAIETAIGTYNTIKAATDEHRRKLEAAQQKQRGVLAEIGSDREDAAERLIMAARLYGFCRLDPTTARLDGLSKSWLILLSGARALPWALRCVSNNARLANVNLP